jgi:coenzyme PQQ synthesis protein D (PqqD)
MAERPRIVDGLEISMVADGSVVYDPRRDRVHYLNQTAALVLELCTGENDAAAMARALELAYELGEPPAAETRACLEQLAGEGLIG